MLPDEYQELAMRTAGKNVRGDIKYSMAGVAAEAGEYADVVKKFCYHDTLTFFEARQLAIKELGDVLWGIAQAADAWNTTIEEIMVKNIEKLKLRYPDGFTAADAKERKDGG